MHERHNEDLQRTRDEADQGIRKMTRNFWLLGAPGGGLLFVGLSIASNRRGIAGTESNPELGFGMAAIGLVIFAVFWIKHRRLARQYAEAIASVDLGDDEQS